MLGPIISEVIASAAELHTTIGIYRLWDLWYVNSTQIVYTINNVPMRTT